ncbi:hypothetical protein HFX_1856 [Haloferax mediterranei ATCC 33500]|uniref:Uncharacterized protein n=1 Tax=Haloferax mediterranei (strain ATCC 33500 / DSM 1411 / JCM 8866 / NBRC 14739 / NCIMB 2177 / R-4) TaxID=523841 RepID=I3R5P5_HALMT|nr:hypothetical protein HFX_1856 [Haloferax mediterranei ATCC 33500]
MFDGVVGCEHRPEESQEEEPRDDNDPDECESVPAEEPKLVYEDVLPVVEALEYDRPVHCVSAHSDSPPLAETVGSKYAYSTSAARLARMTARAMMKTAACTSG